MKHGLPLVCLNLFVSNESIYKTSKLNPTLRQLASFLIPQANDSNSQPQAVAVNSRKTTTKAPPVFVQNRHKSNKHK